MTSLPLFLSLSAYGAFGTLAGACVGLGLLTANRQTATMTNTAIAAYFRESFDIESNFATQVAFDLVFISDDFQSKTTS